ncbi:sigma factor [Bacillus phage Bcp1]|uniref:Uncharacterized protein n=1 Tax=Bacillus phage Bcp1 TaxID=584892 RepID=X2JUS2_9CAUD|nr:sigma factor [Bacillus phage Bcp1]AHN66676.1 hypothetical protein Bcp1_201 [Bacillus phage Bcp1]
MSTTYETFESKKQAAIKLLQETTLTLREIGERTGLSAGTVGSWSKEHRPAHISKRNQRLGSLKGAETTRKILAGRPRGKKVNVVLPNIGDFKEDDESTNVVMSVDTETSISNDPFDFHFSINASEANIDKEEAVSRLRSALEILEGLPSSKVSLNLSINKGEK